MFKYLSVVILLLLAFGLGYLLGWNQKLDNQPVITKTEYLSPVPKLTSENLMKTVNDWRISQNLQPYIQSEFLCKAANERLPEIKSDFSHKEFHAARWCPDCTMGENLAREYYTPQETLDAWLISPKHRENLQRNFTHSCIATDGMYTVQVFGYY